MGFLQAQALLAAHRVEARKGGGHGGRGANDHTANNGGLMRPPGLEEKEEKLRHALTFSDELEVCWR